MDEALESAWRLGYDNDMIKTLARLLTMRTMRELFVIAVSFLKGQCDIGCAWFSEGLEDCIKDLSP